MLYESESSLNDKKRKGKIMKLKKIAIAALAFSTMVALSACGKNENNDNADTTPTAVPTVEATATPPTTDPDPTKAPTETPAPTDAPAENTVMTYAEYAAAELDTPVVIEAYVQAKQSWWDNKATVYTQDENGAYFLYNMACSEEDYAKLVPGTKIKVSGYKAEWSGEVEIVDATFEIVEGSFVAEAKDVTSLLGSDELINYQNQFVSFKGMTVVAAGQNDAGEDVAFLYNWDGSGEEGSDLYFNVSLNDKTYTFTVESYLCDKTTDVYAAVKNLKIGDVIDMEGFLYWYNGVNPHITSVK